MAERSRLRDQVSRSEPVFVERRRKLEIGPLCGAPNLKAPGFAGGYLLSVNTIILDRIDGDLQPALKSANTSKERYQCPSS